MRAKMVIGVICGVVALASSSGARAAGGGHIWSMRMGGPGAVELTYGIASDPSGAALITGVTVDGPIDLGGGPLDGNGEIFLAKYGSTGAHEWSKRLGSLLDEPFKNCAPDCYALGFAVASDPTGNVILGGWSNTSGHQIDLGGGGLLGAGGEDMLLAKYSPTGDHVWSKILGGTAPDEALSVAADPSGNVLLAGGTGHAPIDLGGGAMQGPGGSNIVLAKYDAAGEHQWSKVIGGRRLQDARGVCTDPLGNVVVVGSTESPSIDFGGGPLVSPESAPEKVFPANTESIDVVVAKYSPDGEHMWSKRLGGLGTDYSEAVACDRWGNVVIAGETTSYVADFGGGPLPTSASLHPIGGNLFIGVNVLAPDVFVAKYSPTGQYVWSKRCGGGLTDYDSLNPLNDEHGSSVAVDPSGNVLLGFMTTSVQIDPGGGPVDGEGRFVFAKYAAAAGEHLWSRRVGDGWESLFSIASDPAGDVLLGGDNYGEQSFSIGGDPLARVGDDDVVVAKFQG